MAAQQQHIARQSAATSPMPSPPHSIAHSPPATNLRDFCILPPTLSPQKSPRKKQSAHSSPTRALQRPTVPHHASTIPRPLHQPRTSLHQQRTTPECVHACTSPIADMCAFGSISGVWERRDAGMQLSTQSRGVSPFPWGRLDSEMNSMQSACYAVEADAIGFGNAIADDVQDLQVSLRPTKQ